MRFGFYTSLSLGAILATESRMALGQEQDYQDDELMLAQLQDLTYSESYLNELAQLDNEKAWEEDNQFAQVEGHSESDSESGSGSASESESDSDSDSTFSNLELAQQMQELNYLNALGTINAAQVQAMQSMGSMGMMQPMGQMGQMGQMAAQTGTGGLSFAQIDAEDDLVDETSSRDMYLAQLAVVLAHMPEQDVDTMESYLAQIESSEESHENVFAQIGVDEDDNLAKLATLLAQLGDDELAQLTDILEDSNNDEMFAQIDSESEGESESDSEGEDLAEIDSESESEGESESDSEGEDLAEIDFESGDEDEMIFSQVDIDALNDEMFDQVAEFLAQIGDEDRDMLQSLVGQVMAQSYSENGNILLAQAEGEGEAKESQNEDLDAVAEYLAQLDADELQKMTTLVETKSQIDNEADLKIDTEADNEVEAQVDEDEEIELSQIDDFDYDEYLY